MRPHVNGVDLLLALVVDPRLDQIFGKDAALQQEVVIGFQRVDDRLQRAGRLRHLGRLLGSQVI